MKNIFSNPALLARFTFIVIAALWAVMAFLSFGQVNGADLPRTIHYATNSLFMFVGGAFALFFAFRLSAKNKRVYQFSLGFVVLSAALSLFSKIGALEIVFIVVNIFALYVLYVYSDEFTETAS